MNASAVREETTIADWNVVATTQPGEFMRAMQLLERFGEVKKTDFFNVLVLKVADISQFLNAYLERASKDQRLAACLSRVTPLTRTFRFADAEEFRERIEQAAADFPDQLEGRSFHVRMNRRGFKGELSGQGEEQSLDGFLLAALAERGAPGRIDFEDPDAIIDIETIGETAGVALWTREDLMTYPFLKID